MNGTWWLEKVDQVFRFIRVKDGVKSNLKLLDIESSLDPGCVKVCLSTPLGNGKKNVPLDMFSGLETPLASSWEKISTPEEFLRVWQTVKQQSSANIDELSTNAHDQDGVSKDVQTECMGAEEECGSIAIAQHLIAKNFMVKVELLSQPSEERCVRPPDSDHIERLQKELLQSHLPTTNRIIVNIPGLSHDAVKANLEKVNNGCFTLEVIGGNHTRVALQNILAMPSHKDMERFQFIECILYTGLSIKQALHIGIDHNRQHEVARQLTFREVTSVMRKMFVSSTETDASLQATKTDRTQWKTNLTAVLNTTKTTLNNRYKHSLFLASQPSAVWDRCEVFLKAWESGKIKGQPTKIFRPYHAIFLRKLTTAEERVHILDGLISRTKSWQEISREGKSLTSKSGKSDCKDAKQQLPLEKSEDQASLKTAVCDLGKEESGLKKKESNLKVSLKELQMYEAKLKTWASELEAKEKELKKREMALQASNLVKDQLDTLSDETHIDMSEVEETNESVEKVPKLDTPGIEHNQKQISMPNADTCTEGDWVAVIYSKKAFIGQVKDIQRSEAGTVHFLNGKRLSKSDIQLVEKKFFLCKVEITDQNNEITLSPSAKNRVENERKKYVEKYLNER